MKKAFVGLLAGVLLSVAGTGASSAVRTQEMPLDHSPRWSPDGRWISFCRGRAYCTRQYLVRPEGRDLHRIYGGAILWDPTMKNALIVSGGGRLYLADGSGVGRKLVTRSSLYVDWAPDGRRFAFSDGSSNDLQVATVSPLVVRDFSLPVTLCEQCVLSLGPVDWSGDGRSIALQASVPFIPVDAKNIPDSLYVLDLATARWQRLTGAGLCRSEMAWSPDSRLIAFFEDIDCEGRVRLQVIRRNGAGLRTITQVLDGGSLFRWAPRGPRIAVHVAEVRVPESVVVLDLRGRTLIRFPGAVEFDWSPDGRRLVLQRGGRLYLGDARPGGKMVPIGRGEMPAWSPDGSAIAYVVGGCTRPSGLHVRTLKTGYDRQLTRPCR